VQTVDAVVIGAGPNGLVAANLLADHGWDVMILETQDSVGGAVRSDNEVAPGYTHDTFSSFYPLAAASPTIRSLDLHQHGLVWAHAPAVVGTPYASGPWALLHRTAEETAAGLEAAAPGDGDAWLAMCGTWQRVGDSVVGALLSPFPPIRHGVGALARMSRHGGLAMVRQLLSPASTLTRQEFKGEGARMLLAANAAHADISLDAPGSGMLGWLLAMLGQHVGFPVPQGGAGMLANALADRFSAQGGSISCGARVDQIVVRGGRASGVRTEHGDTIEVRRAVVADVAAPNLYGGLLAWEHLPPSLQGKMARFEWDPGTVKVDWALDGPIPWKDPPSHAPGTVHLCESIDELNITQVQLSAGAVPDRPFLILGQMTSSDATRSPTGTEAVWAYTHVPQRIRTDAATSASGRVRGTWDRDDAEAMADRMQRRIEEYAPDFASRVVARRALTPRDLEDRDENLVGGAINGGTASLQQQLFLRPVPGLGRAETPVRGLYLGSSSAHPGGGVHGACGANAARAALAHDRVRRVWRGWRPEREPA
jgi:phytoene dehydrogenase-like protein